MSCFENRVQKDCYGLLWWELRLYEPTLTPGLGTMAYGEEFYPHNNIDPDGTSIGKITYFSEGENPTSEASFRFFGQIAHSTMGTEITAKGNARGGNVSNTD